MLEKLKTTLLSINTVDQWWVVVYLMTIIFITTAGGLSLTDPIKFIINLAIVVFFTTQIVNKVK